MEEYDWSPYFYISFVTCIEGYFEGTWNEYDVRWVENDTLYMTYRGSREHLIRWLNTHWKKIVDEKTDSIILGE